MDPLAYKIVHLVGVMVLFMGLGIGLWADASARKHGSVWHGVGMLIILVAGFGLVAKLKLGFPAWIIVKLVIWLLLGVLPVLVKCKRVPPLAAAFAALLLGLAAAYLGVYKSF